MVDKDMLVSFSFVCQSDNVSRVKNLLVDLGMTSIVASDSEIHGVCEISELQEIMQILSKHKIAGYNQETQIISRPYLPRKNTSVN